MTPAQLGLKVFYTQQDLNHLERNGCAVQIISFAEATNLTLKRKIDRSFNTDTPCVLLYYSACNPPSQAHPEEQVCISFSSLHLVIKRKKHKSLVFSLQAWQNLLFCSEIRAWGQSGNWSSCHSWVPLSRYILQTALVQEASKPHTAAS